MATLSLLPIWAFMYMQGLKPQAPKLSGPLAEGAHQYKSCQTCHGGKGEGGSGRQLSEGEVLKTFPRIEDQLNWVYNGTSAFQLAKIPTYGDPARPGGARVPGSFGAAMPQQGAKAGGGLSEAEILAVVCDERYPIGGADRTTEPYQAEFELWCSPESEIWVALEQGAADFDNLSEKFKAKGVIPIGTAPRLGSSAKK